MKKQLKLVFIILLMFITSISFSEEYTKAEKAAGSYLDKSHAQVAVHKLTRTNIKKIDFIEVIAINFGYIDVKEVKKNYWKARLYVTRGDIIGAAKILVQNEDDINFLLKKISKVYIERTKAIMNESSSVISQYHMDVGNTKDRDEKLKLAKNRLRIKVANDEFKKAARAMIDKRYMALINHLRYTKNISITVLKELSGPHGIEDVLHKYKIDIVDNQKSICKNCRS